jgi:hypothetical protein
LITLRFLPSSCTSTAVTTSMRDESTHDAEATAMPSISTWAAG